MEEETQKHHLEGGTIGHLFLLAVLTDLISLIPVVGDIVDPFYWRHFNKRLKRDGVKPSSNVLRTRLIALVIKLIPVLQELPATLVGTAIIVVMIRAEEKTHIPISRIAGAGEPLYKNGRRLPQSSGSFTSGASDTDTRPFNKNGARQPTKTFTGYGAPGQSSPYGEQEGPYAGTGSIPPKPSLSGTMGSAEFKSRWEKEIQDKTYIQAKQRGFTEEQAIEQATNSTKEITEQSWKAHDL